jgi:hypothetical protein
MIEDRSLEDNGKADCHRPLELAQAAYLNRCAPGHRTRRVSWSEGTTQMIELGEGPPLLLLHGGMGEAIDRSVDVRGMKKELLLADRWKDLSVPTTFVWGERDAWAAPELGEAVAAMNARVRMVRIPDAGHAPWVDAPERVVDAIEGALR